MMRIAECISRGAEFLREGVFDKAQSEVETIYAMDPGNVEAQEMEVRILTAQQRKEDLQSVSQSRTKEGEAWKKEEEQKLRIARESRELLKQESIATYRGMLRDAWIDGQPAKEEREMLGIVRQSLGLDEAEHILVETEVRREVFAEALKSALRSGVVTPEDSVTRENLRTMYGIASDDFGAIESRLLRELKQEGGK
jgi:hypothetical protein